MKDSQLRGLLLQIFYAHRRDDFITPTAADIGHAATDRDVLHICHQLGEHGLIEWEPTGGLSDDGSDGMGKITAFGIDVVEGEVAPDIKVEIVQNQTVVTNSTNVVVGNYNSQTVTQTVRDLVAVIDSSAGSVADKADAKSLLRKLLEHPLLAALAGGAIGLLG